MKKLCYVLLALLASCGGGEKAGGARPPGQVPAPGRMENRAAAGVTIGLSVATATFIIERWNKDVRVFTGAAQEPGAEVIVQLSAGGTRDGG